MIPDWQLPPGVDRGLWDYLHSEEMVSGYDAQMRASALASADIRYCETWLTPPGRLVDLGCGTGRLAIHMASLGHVATGVDLSPEMLTQAERNSQQTGVNVTWQAGNLVALTEIPDASFDHAASLFSTLGMIRGTENRERAMREVQRILKPGGRFVWHVHNRYFAGLGWRETLGQTWKTITGHPQAGEVTSRQAYAGAALTLHHFTRQSAAKLLVSCGFRILDWQAITVTGELRPTRAGWDRGAYGYLIASERLA
jgi:ubiquinone/menaquinone biosynthesis C-methylase UbiE